MQASIVIAGTHYNLQHLATTRLYAPVLLRGGAAPKSLPVDVAYTNHCICRDPLQGEMIPQTHVIWDGKERRMFCERRYQLSIQLPGIMHALLQQGSHVFDVEGGNYARVDVADELADGTIVQVKYIVIMRLRKHAEPGQQKHIKLRVETAYPEDLSNYRQTRLGRDPYTMSKILKDIWEGR